MYNLYIFEHLSTAIVYAYLLHFFGTWFVCIICDTNHTRPFRNKAKETKTKESPTSRIHVDHSNCGLENLFSELDSILQHALSLKRGVSNPVVGQNPDGEHLNKKQVVGWHSPKRTTAKCDSRHQACFPASLLRLCSNPAAARQAFVPGELWSLSHSHLPGLGFFKNSGTYTKKPPIAKIMATQNGDDKDCEKKLFWVLLGCKVKRCQR